MSFYDTTEEFHWGSLFVESAYGQRHRAYHTTRHLQDIFYMAKDMNIQLTREQKLAILYHDIVYIPGNSTNEELSVLLMETHIAQEPEFFKMAWPNVDVEKVKQIILDTKSHIATFEESKVVLDLDMAIMGADEERYVEYVQEIKKEFAKFQGPQFAEGRAKFLQSLVGIRIFHLDQFSDKFDDAAQDNIKAELLSMGL